jgi:hypothetical protein
MSNDQDILTRATSEDLLRTYTQEGLMGSGIRR